MTLFKYATRNTTRSTRNHHHQPNFVARTTSNNSNNNCLAYFSAFPASNFSLPAYCSCYYYSYFLGPTHFKEIRLVFFIAWLLLLLPIPMMKKSLLGESTPY